MATLRPFSPVFLRVAQGVLRVHFTRWLFVRSVPGQNEWDTVSLRHFEFGNRCQVFAVRLDWRPEYERVRAGNGLQPTVCLADPRNDSPVVETDNELHFDRNFAGYSLNNADHIRI